MKRCEIEGAQKGLEALHKAIDKVKQQADQRYQRSIGKTGRGSDQSLALRAECQEISNTIGRWTYIVQGRVSDLARAAASMDRTEESHETTAKNAAQAAGSDQGEPGPDGGDRQLRETGHAADAED